LGAQAYSQRASNKSAEKALEDQQKQLDRTFAEQNRQLDRTLAEQHKQVDRTLDAQTQQLDRTLSEQRTRTFNERFATAAGQLGSDKPPEVRLAGVYAIAGLADDWKENRQTCVDVLCAYLRMPYKPDPGDESPVSERLVFLANREVRYTVMRVITAHLQEDAAVSWQGRNFDFTGTVFDGGSFSGATFSGGTLTFNEATFSCGTLTFNEATFSCGTLTFNGATFSGGTVTFHGAKFSGGAVNFIGAKFSGGTVAFGPTESVNLSEAPLSVFY
jgi:uncharacterized protein YjbI with pentapeptide repeats